MLFLLLILLSNIYPNMFIYYWFGISSSKVSWCKHQPINSNMSPNKQYEQNMGVWVASQTWWASSIFYDNSCIWLLLIDYTTSISLRQFDSRSSKSNFSSYLLLCYIHFGLIIIFDWVLSSNLVFKNSLSV